MLHASPEILAGVMAGNASRAVRALADAYGVQPWAADALAALSTAALAAPGSSPGGGGGGGGGGGLAGLLNERQASARLEEIVSDFNASAALLDLGGSSEALALAIEGGRLVDVAAVLAPAVPLSLMA